MLKFKLSFAAPVILSLASTLAGCGSDASPKPASSDAGFNSGGSPGDLAGSGGSPGDAGADSRGSAGDAGADSGGSPADAGADSGGASSSGGAHAGSAGANAAGGAPATSPMGPCHYSISGEQSLPDGDAKYLCTAISRLWQQKGKGDFDLLFGGGFYTDDTHVSTLACSLTSKVAPAAGDVWVLGEAHPGNCEVDYSVGSTTSAWKSTTGPAVAGSASIKFLSATLTHGTNKPEDVYYTFEIELTATMPGVPGVTPDTSEVTINGTFSFPSLPLGS
ncbi:MAG: hypothetical protein WDO69_06390 [Pseudomonadota bacterium]